MDVEPNRILSSWPRRAELAADLSNRVPPGDPATVLDASSAAGVRGTAGGWNYDASGQYGYNSFDFTIGNTLNVSLGPRVPPNKTTFDAGELVLNQFVGNLDLSRAVRMGGFAGPLNVAFGTGPRTNWLE